MKARSDHNRLKNYTRLQVFSWVCLELIAETNQYVKMMRMAMTRNRLRGDTLLNDIYIYIYIYTKVLRGRQRRRVTLNGKRRKRRHVTQNI